MKIERVVFFCATPKLDKKQTLTWFNKTRDYKINPLWIFETDNKQSLSKIYNNAIKKSIEQYDADCLILIHDDVILEEDPIPKLEILFDEYDLVGVAGCSKAKIESPSLWHIMGGGFLKGNLHGKVQHGDHNHKNETYFGKYPHKCVMIDGVFMALSKEIMKNVKFDEKNPASFHHYDLNYSLDSFKSGYRVGVGDILITHASEGLTHFTDEWRCGDDYFIKKYGQ